MVSRLVSAGIVEIYVLMTYRVEPRTTKKKSIPLCSAKNVMKKGERHNWVSRTEKRGESRGCDS